jgi:acetyl esterase/lipase
VSLSLVLAVEKLSYGEHADQWLQLALSNGRPAGTAVLLHGGFWRAAWTATLMESLAEDLVDRGWNVANAEFRRMNEAGEGGYPVILEDVSSAIETLVRRWDEVPRPLVAIGHSAGGHLALWAAAHQSIAADTAKPRPVVVLDGVVSQAGVLDLVGAARARIGRNAVPLMMGATPEQEPRRYDRTCPTKLLPLGVAQLLVHGTEDEHVPWEMSERYHRAASAAGDEVELALLDGVGHFEHLDPSHAAWGAVVEWLKRLSGEGSSDDRGEPSIAAPRDCCDKRAARS